MPSPEREIALEEHLARVYVREVDAADAVKEARLLEAEGVCAKALPGVQGKAAVRFPLQVQVQHQLEVGDADIKVAVLGVEAVVLPLAPVNLQAVAGKVHGHDGALLRPSLRTGGHNRRLTAEYGKHLAVCRRHDPLEAELFLCSGEHRRQIRQREKGVPFV